MTSTSTSFWISRISLGFLLYGHQSSIQSWLKCYNVLSKWLWWLIKGDVSFIDHISRMSPSSFLFGMLIYSKLSVLMVINCCRVLPSSVSSVLKHLHFKLFVCLKLKHYSIDLKSRVSQYLEFSVNFHFSWTCLSLFSLVDSSSECASLLGKLLCLLNYNYLGIVTLRVSITQPVDSFTFTVQPIRSELLLCGASKFDFVMEALALAIWCYLVATPEALIQVCTL